MHGAASPAAALTSAHGASAVGTGAEASLGALLLALIVILFATAITSRLVTRLGQTQVVGEILAGLLLGPSLLGALAPGAVSTLFSPQTAPAMTALSQLGLVLFMFQIGLEFEFAKQLGDRRIAIALVSIAGIVVPFILGFLTAPWFYARLSDGQPPQLAFRLFMAVAMSITAIPILGRIFLELRLEHTRVASFTIGAAAIDDMCGWLLLGVVALLASGQDVPLPWLALRCAGMLAYGAFVWCVLRPQLGRVVRAGTLEGRFSPGLVPLILFLLFISAAITSRLGVFAIIGGFVLGFALHEERAFVAAWRERVGPLVSALLLPIFFTYTGLRTDIGALATAEEAWSCLLVCLIAFAGKLGGVYFSARAVGEDHRSAFTIATCMNTRALMELVAINVGYDLGVLPRSMFTKLVIMAVASTFIATPLIRRLMRGQEAAPPALAPGWRLAA